MSPLSPTQLLLLLAEPTRLRIGTGAARIGIAEVEPLQAAHTPDEAKAILKAVPGLKITLDPEITIEFE